MEDFSDYFNPIQREYIYNVCKRLAPYLDKFDNSIRLDDKKVIIFKILIDSLFDMNIFLDLLKRNSIKDVANYVVTDLNKEFPENKLPISEDKELIIKAYNCYKSLFLAENNTINLVSKMPSDILDKYVRNTCQYDQNLFSECFKKRMTDDFLSLNDFVDDFEVECDEIKRSYVSNENKKIEDMYIDEHLYNAISGTIYPYENMHIYISSFKDYLERFFDHLVRNECVLDYKRQKLYDELKPGVVKTYQKIEKRWSIEALKYFYDYAYVTGLERMNLEDYLDYLFLTHKNEMMFVLKKVKIDPEKLIEIINQNKNKEMFKLDLIRDSEEIEEQLKKKVGEANAIKVPKFEYETSVNIYEYGEEELKLFTKIINEITIYATNNIASENVLTDCINGVIPRLTIFDRLSSKKMSQKMENQLEDTKDNLTDIESNLKQQIKVYEYLLKVYEKRLEFIIELEKRIDSVKGNSNTETFLSIGLAKKKENLTINRINTLTMIGQIQTLAHNHINILNMLYRTRETFITVIESQTLINSSVSQEKAALKNIRNIVDIYDSALSNDFVSAFSLIERLKSNGLDQTSALQLETNITNIQNLFSPSVVDENVINKPAKGSVSKRPVKRLTRTDNVLYKKENIDK